MKLHDLFINQNFHRIPEGRAPSPENTHDWKRRKESKAEPLDSVLLLDGGNGLDLL